MKPNKKLKNSPLLEAIFEIRWKTSKVDPKVKKNSQLIAGVLSEKVKGRYDFFEPLDASKVPLPEHDNFSGIALYRFRLGENKYPLMQIGSGMMSVNDTEKYEWADFKIRCIEDLKIFLSISDVMTAVDSIKLTYINSVPFDFNNEDVISFIKEKMGISIRFPEDAFQEAGIGHKSENINAKFSFPSETPKGSLNFSLASGKVKNADSLVWENSFTTTGNAVPKNLKALESWLDESHQKLENWFFVLIDNWKSEFE